MKTAMPLLLKPQAETVIHGRQEGKMTFENANILLIFSPDLYTTPRNMKLKFTLANPTYFLPSTMYY